MERIIRLPSEEETNAVMAEFEATSRKGRGWAAESEAALDEATPVLVKILSECWDTGQGTRVRNIIWSLYSGSHLVQLGYGLSGFDFKIGKAVSAAITARIAVGPDVEDKLRVILRESGEFDRLDAAVAAARALGKEPVYPPMPVSSDTLRRLADGVQASEE